MKSVFVTAILAGSFLMTGSVQAVQVIAHRGASAYAPENTLASVNLAWDLNVDAVEIDVYLTADNRIVAIHDANTQRTTGVNLNHI